MSWFNCGVYIIRNTRNNKVYVGSAVSFKNRWSKHRRTLEDKTHANPKLQAAWNKYGAEAFNFEVVVYCPKYQLLWHEQMAIDAFNSVKYGYNICPVAGNRLGATMSELAKERISASLQGNQRAKGLKHTEETLAKIRAGAKGNKCATGNTNRRGQRHTVESRQKMAESHKGFIWSEESKAKVRASLTGRNLGKKLSESHKQAMRDGWARRKQSLLENNLSIPLTEYAAAAAGE